MRRGLFHLPDKQSREPPTGVQLHTEQHSTYQKAKLTILQFSTFQVPLAVCNGSVRSKYRAQIAASQNTPKRFVHVPPISSDLAHLKMSTKQTRDLRCCTEREREALIYPVPRGYNGLIPSHTVRNKSRFIRNIPSLKVEQRTSSHVSIRQQSQTSQNIPST